MSCGDHWTCHSETTPCNCPPEQEFDWSTPISEMTDEQYAAYEDYMSAAEYEANPYPGGEDLNSDSYIAYLNSH